MCGIAGAFNYRTGAPVDRRAVERMGRVQAHRGPDAESTYFDRSLGFAHRRLSIIDLADRGRQPMSTIDGRYVIVYNGEIYNYLELRRELQIGGWPFRTDTDTEVVLALYALHGAQCLDRLNGMFAFAIWDAHERRLFIARDRVGIKPLYYVETRDGLVFASEAKALFEYPDVACDMAESHVGVYMAFGYLPGEETMFRDVRKLRPGHYLEVCRRGARDTRYWRLSYNVDSARSADDTASQLRDLLLDAVRIHMRSDVPVGVFLSGGLDSSATVALLHEAGIRDLQTFSVAYREGEYFDESGYARLVADRFGATHRTLYVDPQRFAGFIPEYVWHMDEPVDEAAGISLYFVAKLLREHVTVALSGEGADELFAGYEVYSFMRWIERYHRLPRAVRGVIARALRDIEHPRLQKFLRLGAQPLETRYLGVPLPGAGDDSTLYTPELRKAVEGRAPSELVAPYFAETRGRDALTRMLYTDLNTWLVDDLLIKADKMTMANSVELRVPFLDHRVVEFAATVPSHMKLRNGSPKWILKRALAGRLPPEILQRPKVGFPTPLSMMFRGELTDYVRDVLLSPRSRARGLFTTAAIEHMITQHVSRRRDHHRTLWRLIVLEEWQRKFIDVASWRHRPAPVQQVV